MVVFRVQAKLGLNSSAVYAIFVQTLPNRLCYSHVPLSNLTLLDGEVELNVKRRNRLGLAQLPQMDMVTVEDSRDLLHIFFDIVDIKMIRCTL